jgi:hypothetical protein
MNKEPIFSVDRLRQLVKYDSKTGALFWKPRQPSDFLCAESSRARVSNGWNAKYADQPIESRMGDGRVIVHFNLGRRWRTQGARVAWAIHHGTWPEGLVDHIDGDCTNDRIENLREVSASENNRNQRIGRRNTSGKVGVTFFKRTGKWRAWINIDGRSHSLGYFTEIEDAIAARVAAENRHGFFEATRQSEEAQVQA